MCVCVCVERVPSTHLRRFFPLFLSHAGKGTNCGFLISNQSTSSVSCLCVYPVTKKKERKKKEKKDRKRKITQWTLFVSPAEMNS